MKIVKLIIICLIVIVMLLAGAVFVFIRMFNVEKYKDVVTNRISEALHRPVTLEKLDLNISYSEGVTLVASGLNIEDLADVKKTVFVLDLEKYIKDREIVIPEVIVNSPIITAVQSELLKVGSLADSPEQAEDSAEAEESKEVSKVPPDFTVQRISIKDGALSYTDDLADEPFELNVASINVDISNFSFNRSFQYDLRCSIWSAKQESLHIQGQAIIFPASQKVRLHDLKVDVLLDRISVERVYQSFPEGKSSGLAHISQGTLGLFVDQLLIEEGAMFEFVAKGELADTRLHFDFIPVPMTVDSQFLVTQSDMSVDQFKVGVADGTIFGTGAITDYANSMNFETDITINQVDLSQVIDQEESAIKGQGRLIGRLKAQGQGLSMPSLSNHLTGTGNLKIKDGRLVDFNLLRFVLEKLSMFPNLTEKLQKNLSPENKDKINQSDTVINDAKSDLKIAAGHIIFENSQLDADGFIFSAKGDVDFDLNADIESAFYLSTDLSESIIQTEEELSVLQDEYNQIRIPFKRFRGKIEKFKPEPAVDDLFKQALKNRGKNELKKAIFKALDLEDGAEVTPGSQLDDGQVDAPQQKKPEEEVIEGLIESLPIFK